LLKIVEKNNDYPNKFSSIKRL